MAPIVDSSAVSTTTPITSNAATLIPPKPIQPTTVTGPTGSGVTLNSGLGTSKTFCGNCGKPVLSSMIKCPSCGQPTGVTPSVGGVNAPVSFTQPSVNVSASSNAASYASVPQVNTGVQLASRWARWFAAIIDNSIVGMIVTWLIMKVLFPNELSDLTSGDLNDPYAVGTAYGQTSLIVSVLMILYHAILNATDEAGTLGKMICGIRVREISGDRISFMKSLGRTLITYLPFLYIGILWIFFTEKRQTLADKICKTIVIKKG
jgi:uncharacterized RDD family membrane protein YckC